jgi:hypothetical protein
MNRIAVVFRRHRTGDCFALFPELPGDTAGVLCTGYAGRHCAADYDRCIAHSDPAVPDDYKNLYQELLRRGYDLSVRRKATPEMHERRLRLAAERREMSSRRRLQGTRT